MIQPWSSGLLFCGKRKKIEPGTLKLLQNMWLTVNCLNWSCLELQCNLLPFARYLLFSSMDSKTLGWFYVWCAWKWMANKDVGNFDLGGGRNFKIVTVTWITEKGMLVSTRCRAAALDTDRQKEVIIEHPSHCILYPILSLDTSITITHFPLPAS